MSNISITEKLAFTVSIRCTAIAFKELIGDHPVAPALKDDIEKCWESFLALQFFAVDTYHRALCDESTSGDIPRPRLWEPPSKAIDNAQADEETEIVSGHYHEMMDRASCLIVLFNSLVVKHSAASLCPTIIEMVDNQLADLYQKAARLDFDKP